MIRCEKLTKRYGKTLALDAFDLTIEQGELHGFVGPNGAGKTTTMKILATLLRPTSGDATVDGVSVIAEPQKARRQVGYMPDFFGVYDNLKVWEYLDLYAGCLSIGAKGRRRRIDELLELMALTDKREAYVDGLSRGMKQRLCLARALIHDPKLLILDEPASGMDPRSRAEMREILREIGQMGKTVIISSHILPELSELCSSMTILANGKPTFSGSVEELERKISIGSALVIRFSSEPEEKLAECMQKKILELYGEQARRDQEHAWRIDVKRDEAGDAALLRELIALSAPVCDFHREKATLERVFMEVTGE